MRAIKCKRKVIKPLFPSTKLSILQYWFVLRAAESSRRLADRVRHAGVVCSREDTVTLHKHMPCSSLLPSCHPFILYFCRLNRVNVNNWAFLQWNIDNKRVCHMRLSGLPASCDVMALWIMHDTERMFLFFFSATIRQQEPPLLCHSHRRGFILPLQCTHLCCCCLCCLETCPELLSNWSRK